MKGSVSRIIRSARKNFPVNATFARFKELFVFERIKYVESESQYYRIFQV